MTARPDDAAREAAKLRDYKPCEALAMRLGIPLGPVRDEWDECSAIREFEGGYPRAEAERLAMVDVTRYFEAQVAARRARPAAR